MYTLQQQTERALQLLNDGLGQGGEVDCGVLVKDVLGQLRNRLGIRLRLKLHALTLQQLLELLVVGDDTIVDDRELPLRVGAVWVAVESAGHAVGGPSGVRDTGVVIEDLGPDRDSQQRDLSHLDSMKTCDARIWLLLLNQLLQLRDLADLLEGKDLILLVAIDGETGGVVAAVFETSETVDESWSQKGITGQLCSCTSTDAAPAVRTHCQGWSSYPSQQGS